jgi:hypothetical protein
VWAHHARHDAIVSLAGPAAADGLVGDRSSSWDFEEGAIEDVDKAEHALRCLYMVRGRRDFDAEFAIDQAFFHAHDLVASYWLPIERVAAALLGRGSLDYRQIVALVGKLERPMK